MPSQPRHITKGYRRAVGRTAEDAVGTTSSSTTIPREAVTPTKREVAPTAEGIFTPVTSTTTAFSNGQAAVPIREICFEIAVCSIASSTAT